MLAWTRGCGQTTEDGAYANQRLNLADDGKAHRRQAKVSNRTTGNPAVRDYRGASGNVAMVEMRSRLAYRKSESGNPPPTAGAPELYPNTKTPGVCGGRACIAGHRDACSMLWSGMNTKG